ncbi:glycosyltransferase [Asticcacaulis sp.]|uniref:glycosyltransferase family 32 protein n=1 Tax=Asticcacaulis sp. TaxID=1872648 RepID=UPI0031E04BAC
MKATKPARAPKQKNPKILHRVYFDNMAPFRDPFKHYLQTWEREMPDYEIMKWNASNVDLNANEWVQRAAKAKSPVFISEFVRWDALNRHGGMYIDADCEILNGGTLSRLIDELYESDEYDAFIGVEESENGHPTAQTVAAKKGSALVEFMLDMYNRQLSGPLWHWREERGLIGPQLMSLYFRDIGFTINKGFFRNLDSPMVFGRVKVYTQDYFSPKFTSTGKKLNVSKNTCIYHLFSNLNLEQVDPEAKKHREKPLLFDEYCEYLEKNAQVSLQSQLVDLAHRHDVLHEQKTALEAQLLQIKKDAGILPRSTSLARVEKSPSTEAVDIFQRHIALRDSAGRINLVRLLKIALKNPRYFIVRARNKITGKPWNYH